MCGWIGETFWKCWSRPVRGTVRVPVLGRAGRRAGGNDVGTGTEIELELELELEMELLQDKELIEM